MLVTKPAHLACPNLPAGHARSCSAQVFWVDLLTEAEFKAGFGSHTPMYTGQTKCVRYYMNFARGLDLFRRVVLKVCCPPRKWGLSACCAPARGLQWVAAFPGVVCVMLSSVDAQGSLQVTAAFDDQAVECLCLVELPVGIEDHAHPASPSWLCHSLLPAAAHCSDTGSLQDPIWAHSCAAGPPTCLNTSEPHSACNPVC